MKTRFALLIFVVLALVVTGFAQQQAAPQQQQQQQAQAPAGPPPLTEKEVTKMLKKEQPQTIIQEVTQRGVDFDMTPEIEKQLRKKKATDEVVAAVRNAGPTARAAAAKLAAMGGHGVTIPPEEAQAWEAIRNELDPDKQIALANDFAQKYPDSPILTYVYAFEAGAYQQKGDVEQVVEACQKSLKVKPDNLMSLIMIAAMLPQPQYVGKHEMEKAKILTQTEEYGQQALKQINDITKQPNETEEAYQKRKEGYAAAVHAALGMVHLERSSMALMGPDKGELAKAEQEFKLAIAGTPNPDPRDYYRLGEAYSLDGKIDDAIAAFTKAGELGQGTMIKSYADQRIADLQKKKAGK